MPRATRIPKTTALRALLDRYTLPQLKLLGRLLEPRLPTRKFELPDRVTRHLVVPVEAESAFRRALHGLGYGLAGERG